MSTWQRWMLISMGVAWLLISPVFVGRSAAAEYPQVANLTPFSVETNYMSLASYLRYLVRLQDKVWLARTEAERVVGQQQEQLKYATRSDNLLPIRTANLAVKVDNGKR